MKRIRLTIFPILFFLYSSLISCTGFLGKVKEKELALIEIPEGKYKLKLVYYPSDATTQASIQLKKIYYDTNREDLLKNYDRYNFVDTFYLKNNKIFVLIIRDTASRLGNKPDTMLIDLD